MKQSTLAATAAFVGGAYLAKRILRSTRAIDFHGRNVLITGGSRGLGLVLARQFAAQGADITLLARDDEELERAVLDVASRGADVLGIPCDITHQKQVQRAIERSIGRHGRLDMLINNAGQIRVGPIDHMSEQDFHDAMAVHFHAPLYTMLAALPHMRVRGEGRIVNISSIGGKIGIPHLVPYCASKFALAGLSESLRAELAEDNILITTVYPGLMRTGSPVNAEFKGRHREEYAWFALMDATPLTSISAVRAARKIVDAARHGDARLVISMQAKIAVMLNELMPEISAQGTALMNRLLPSVSLLQDKESFAGGDSSSKWAPSALTSLSDQAAIENNEVETIDVSTSPGQS
ncbi:MAG TPA: SDR family NAD(P)-dependent oxidoreductase [Tepidisphaeraceae bacterium]|jgi:NAD(P)-dependent dehydrogenase (short-subunit alcohol dehydrogenase family)|nr:SDR family NAD(P)-dependent oxidoreductase [Tepidisphaeraceae bacterium]